MAERCDAEGGSRHRVVDEVGTIGESGGREDPERQTVRRTHGLRGGEGGSYARVRGGRAGGRCLKGWWFVLRDAEGLVVSHGVHGPA